MDNQHTFVGKIILTVISTAGCALFFASCGSSEATVDSDIATADTLSSSPAEPYDSSANIRPEIVTGPTEEENRPMGLTVGERLKRLDSLMRIVPPDSLEVLMAEYDRLLDSTMLAQSSEEELMAFSTEESSPTTSVEGPEPVNETQSANSDNTTIIRSTPRSQAVESNDGTLVQSDIKSEEQFDPSQYNGVRNSEIDYFEENRPAIEDDGTVEDETAVATSNTSTATGPNDQSRSASPVPAPSVNSTNTAPPSTASTTTTPRKTKRRARTAKPSNRRATSAPSSTRTRSSRRASPSLNENYTQGLASFRAGNYSNAIVNLKPVVNSSGFSQRSNARYYYAVSLERTGSLRQAASQYRSLMKGSGNLADKSWIGYARVLSRQGNKTKAKKELLRLIQQRPGSSQVASARKMLQQL